MIIVGTCSRLELLRLNLRDRCPIMHIRTTRWIAGCCTTVAILCSACGNEATPTGSQGAVGVVEQEGAAASQAPESPALSGGPSGQTPSYGQPGAAPSSVVSVGDGASPSAGEDNPPRPSR